MDRIVGAAPCRCGGAEVQLLQKCLVESDESRINACPKASAPLLTDGPSLSGDTSPPSQQGTCQRADLLGIQEADQWLSSAGLWPSTRWDGGRPWAACAAAELCCQQILALWRCIHNWTPLHIFYSLLPTRPDQISSKRSNSAFILQFSAELCCRSPRQRVITFSG